MSHEEQSRTLRQPIITEGVIQNDSQTVLITCTNGIPYHETTTPIAELGRNTGWPIK